MIKEGFAHMKDNNAVIANGINTPCRQASKKRLTLSILIFQAIATSIDAFAVGVGFSAMRVDIIPAVVIIAIITADLVALAIAVGRKFGDILGSHAEIVGGIILVIIGIKAIL
jgi:putative Mn2+ efflux pump MntP